MKRLGLSQPFIELASQNIWHEAFEVYCKSPYYVYHGCRVPAGNPVLPLWDSGEVVFGLREGQDCLEFLEFGIEWVDDFEIIARTEQGVLAYFFTQLFEEDLCNEESDLASLDELSSTLRFEHLSELKKECVATDRSTYENWRSFVRGFVDRIENDQSRG